jgi:hypothetical protein
MLEVSFWQNWCCPQSSFQSIGTSLAGWCRYSKLVARELVFAAAGELSRWPERSKPMRYKTQI